MTKVLVLLCWLSFTVLMSCGSESEELTSSPFALELNKSSALPEPSSADTWPDCILQLATQTLAATDYKNLISNGPQKIYWMPASPQTIFPFQAQDGWDSIERYEFIVKNDHAQRFRIYMIALTKNHAKDPSTSQTKVECAYPQVSAAYPIHHTNRFLIQDSKFETLAVAANDKDTLEHAASIKNLPAPSKYNEDASLLTVSGAVGPSQCVGDLIKLQLARFDGSESIEIKESSISFLTNQRSGRQQFNFSGRLDDHKMHGHLHAYVRKELNANGTVASYRCSYDLASIQGGKEVFALKFDRSLLQVVQKTSSKVLYAVHCKKHHHAALCNEHNFNFESYLVYQKNTRMPF